MTLETDCSRTRNHLVGEVKTLGRHRRRHRDNTKEPQCGERTTLRTEYSIPRNHRVGEVKTLWIDRWCTQDHMF